MSLKMRIRSAVYRARAIALRAQGYSTVNPACRNWEVFPPSRMQAALTHVFKHANVRTPVETLIDHGCWDGHYAWALRPYAKKLIGLDVIEPERVSGYDQYVRVSPEPGLSYLTEIPDNSVDIVLIVSSVGMHAHGKHDADPHCGDWEDYVSKIEERQGRYFTPANYPRVVRPGGYIVIQEWEAYPELRVGKLVPDAVRARIDEFYPHSEIPGFTVAAKGLSPLLIGPYIVFRKN